MLGIDRGQRDRPLRVMHVGRGDPSPLLANPRSGGADNPKTVGGSRGHYKFPNNRN